MKNIYLDCIKELAVYRVEMWLHDDNYIVNTCGLEIDILNDCVQIIVNAKNYKEMKSLKVALIDSTIMEAVEVDWLTLETCVVYEL